MQYKMTPAGKIPEYNEIDHKTWNLLFERQLKLIGNAPCEEWVKGFKLLKLDPHKVPDQKKISDRIYEFTGWRIYNAVDEFLNNDEWFNALARKTFPATTYLRNHDELDFTPYPDLFHEYFGHLPYLTLPKMARIISLFPKAYFITPPELRVGVGRLWWHAMEWQFVKEKGELKAMGAGSLAGKADFLDSIKKTKIPFTINEAFNSLKTLSRVQEKYFYFDSVSHIEECMEEYIETQEQNRGKPVEIPAGFNSIEEIDTFKEQQKIA